MYQIIRQMLRTGIKTEAAPQPDESLRVAQQQLQENILKHFGRALAIRHVDAGSCNGCELEIHCLNNPYYNIEGLGITFVASPRHADMLLVTGPVSRNMEIALQRTYRRHARTQAGGRARRLRLHRRHLRRELRQLRRHRQCHPGGCRRARLPTHADCHHAGHIDCYRCSLISSSLGQAFTLS